MGNEDSWKTKLLIVNVGVGYENDQRTNTFVDMYPYVLFGMCTIFY